MIFKKRAGQLPIYLLNNSGQIWSSYAQHGSIKCHFFMLLIVFIDQHCKPESNILLIRVQGVGNSLPAYGLAEMNIEIPIKDTQQVQYGFPPESGIVRTVPKINCTTEAKKSLNFTPSQPNLEILPHIKDIVRQTGFSNQSSLSRFFRRHTGMSPTEYRRTIHIIR